MSHSHIRDVTGAGTVGTSASAVSSFAAAQSSASTPSTSFFFSPTTSSRSPKFGIYSSSLLNSPSTFALPSPSLQSLGKNPLDLRKSPRLSAIKEEKDDAANGKDGSGGEHGGSMKSGSGSGGVNGYNTLNHFLAPHFRSPLSLSLNGKGDDVDGSLNSPTFIILQAVEQENNAASGRKRKRAQEEEDEEEDDDEEEEEDDEDISSRQLKSSHTASLMLSHTPPHSYAASPRNGTSGLNIPLLTPLLASLGGPFDAEDEEDSAPSSPSAAAAAAAAASSAVTDDTMLMQLTDTASSFSALNTLSTLGNGSSCHQCKSLRPVNQLMYCCNNKKRGSKLAQQQRDASKPSCRKKFCDVCFPEHDTRVLTDTGFLFLADIEARVSAGQRVLYACYDTRTKSIVYRPGQPVVVPPPTSWVDFTHADTRPLWDATSDDYGSTVPADGDCGSRLTLRTTPGHEMYVQLCMQSGETQCPRMADGAVIPAHKMRAEELAPGYQCDCAAAGRTCTHGYSHYRMYTGAASGLQAPGSIIKPTNNDLQSPVTALGLRAADEMDAFLELFGYWLQDGGMSHSSRTGCYNAVVLLAKKERNRSYLRGLLARLHLVRDQHFSSNESDMRLEVCIYEPRWFSFFDQEFGVKYSGSTNYDRQLAKLKQGMHTAQRRSTPPTSESTEHVGSSTGGHTRSRSLSSTVLDIDDGDELYSPSAWSQLSAETESSQPSEWADEEVDDSVESAKWLPEWVLFRLDREQLRLAIDGLRHADGHSKATVVQGLHMICTSGLGFRDQLIHACLHAGYSAYFTLDTRAGEVRGYKAVSDHSTVYTKEEVAELLPAQDVRYDGSGSVQAVHQQQPAAIAPQRDDLYDEKRDGRVWCVNVQHDDHLILVQRVHRSKASGIVTKVGRTIITGNCLAKFYGQKPSSEDMIRSGTDSSWECPSCVGICTCAACRRRKEVAGTSSSAGKGKNGGAKKKAAVEQPAPEQKEQPATAPATTATPAAHTNGQTQSNGTAAAADTLSVPQADTAPLSPLSLSPRNKGVHMEYVEGDESPAVIHIARDSIVLPPSYSPRLTPKAHNGNSQPMEVDAVKVE